MIARHALRSSFLFLTFAAIAGDTGRAEGNANLGDLSLEQLMQIEIPTVYSASKLEQKATQAPSSVTVVASDEIKLHGYRTLADLLRSVPGMYVSYDRNYSFLGTRGINQGDFNSRVLLLVNGHRVNNDLTDGALIGSEFILDVDLIDRVEIIRGPGSVLYGNNAFFGVINVITRAGGSVDGVEASAEYGSFDARKFRVTYGQSFSNGVHVLVSGSFYQSEGADRLFYKEFNTPSQNNGLAQGLDDDAFGSFFGSIAYKDFTLEGAFVRREKENPTAQYFTTFNDPHLKTIDDRSYVTLNYAHAFDSAMDVSARVYYDRNDFEIGYPVGGMLFKEKQSGQWCGAEAQFNAHVWERHVLTLGAEYRNDFDQTRRIYDRTTTYTDVQQSRESYGVFAQGDFELLKQLHLNAGVRFDKYGDFDPSASPRVALIYSPCESTTFKAIYGTAFRDPNFLELSDPRFQNIDPEKITSGELIYEQGIGKHLRSSVSLFHNYMDDLITLQDGNFTNFNVEATGVEAGLEGVWTSGIRSRVSYTWQNAESRSSGIRLTDSPEHLVKLNLSAPLYQEKIFAALELQYASKRRTSFTATTGETLPGPDVEDATVVNLTLFSRNLVKNLEMSASVYNVLGTRNADPATRFHQQSAIAQDGRTFRVKATYRF